MPNAAERRYGVSVTQRLSRWLNEIPISHTTLTDDALTPQSLQHVDVLILGYNPLPTPSMLSVLERYLDRGGKLIVFYGADPKLADLMGVRLGKYMGATGKRYWSGMRFSANPARATPTLIRQLSRSIRPVYPTDPRAHITAVWDNEHRRPSKQPAVVESRHGTWITHVLLDDGDTRNKKQLLLACIGRHLPDVWRTAATHALQQCGVMGNYTNSKQAWQDIHNKVTAEGAPKAAARHYQRATEYYRSAQKALPESRYQQIVELCQKARQELVQAIAVNQPSRTGEIRGVWDHSGLGLYPGNWDRTCQQLRAAGMTDVYVNLLWAGKAHYPSKIVPRSRTYRNYGDQAAACVKAGRRHGLRIHAWKVCWNLEGAPEAFLLSLKQAGRLQITTSGDTIPWLCPSRADNIQYEVDAIRELVKRYPVAGIHLDYIRYRDSSPCCCESCQRGFARDTGLSATPWPGVLSKPATRVIYDRWRCGRITHLVREVHDAIQNTAPALQLSAAVFGRYPQCVKSVAQDWHLWLQRNYVDVVCPMNYTSKLSSFRSWTSAQVALPGAKGRILPGIGVTANESNLDPIQVIEQIQWVRRLGLPGYILFDLNQTLATETLPALSLGISSPL
jgi:uncharacterized lipoprotein YddW (UPF0748 family)